MAKVAQLERELQAARPPGQVCGVEAMFDRDVLREVHGRRERHRGPRLPPVRGTAPSDFMQSCSA